MRSKKKQQKRVFKNTVVVLLLLVVAQAAFLFYRHSGTEVMELPEAIEDAVKGITDPVERARHQLRLAVIQFQVRYRRLPEDFDELVPEFLRSVPQNPKTKAPFQMVVKDKQFELAVDMDEARIMRSSMQGVIAGAEIADGEILDVAAITNDFIYSPSGKRDPFLPITGSLEEGDCDTPITCTSLPKLKLALVIDTGKGKKAMVETPDGRGYTVEVGTKIGSSNGEIVEIQDDRLLILEQFKDILGNVRNSTYEMMLRAVGTKREDNSK